MKKIFINGIVYTGKDIKQAFVVEDNIFTYVGNNQEALAQLNDEDELIDLDHKFVCAGFNDSHIHLLNLGQSLLYAKLHEHTNSLKDFKDYLRQYINDNPDLNWIKGRGWNQDLFTDEKRMPNKNDLDELSIDKPIFLARTCGHMVVVNSKALQIANIDAYSKSPLGGEIDFENGLLIDNAISLVKDLIPLPNKQDIQKMFLSAISHLNSFGITSVQSDDYHTFNGLDYKLIDEVLHELENQSNLNIRIYEQSQFKDYKSLKQFIDDGNITSKGTNFFKTGPIKIVADGSLGSRSAALNKPYNDDPSTNGLLIYSDEELNSMVDYANKNKMQLAIHSIGDRCLDQILNAYELTLNNHPRENHRHGIVHCQITRKDQLEKLAELNMLIYAQTIFLDYDNQIVEDRVGKDLAKTSYNFKTLMNMGLNVSNGSDAPVETANVLKGMQCAITRSSLDKDNTYLIDQAFSVEEAIKSYTINGAYASFEENIKGLIQENYLADFVILDKDLFSVDINKIKDIKVLKTYLNGKCVFSL